jgi:hypothetical protein
MLVRALHFHFRFLSEAESAEGAHTPITKDKSADHGSSVAVAPDVPVGQ